jgi:hypothetical protein
VGTDFLESRPKGSAAAGKAAEPRRLLSVFLGPADFAAHSAAPGGMQSSSRHSVISWSLAAVTATVDSQGERAQKAEKIVADKNCN